MHHFSKQLTVIDLVTARKILGKDVIIGVTASSKAEAIKAAEGGADYLGLGTVYATPTLVYCQTISERDMTILQ